MKRALSVIGAPVSVPRYCAPSQAPAAAGTEVTADPTLENSLLVGHEVPVREGGHDVGHGSRLARRNGPAPDNHSK